jgi:hypothetical protein
MPDPFIQAARAVLALAVNDMRPAIEGLPPEALNWKPASDDSNSIAVLATHSMLSARSWIAIAVGAPRPHRDRDAEFLARAADAESLLALVDWLRAECERMLDEDEVIDWTAMRPTHDRPGGRPAQAPAAWALLHALEHLREHAGHISLTRQLWEARHDSSPPR